MEASIDLLDARVHDNPHAFFRELRELGDGVHFHKQTGAWLVLRYSDVSTVLREHARFSSTWPGKVPGQDFPPHLVETIVRSLLFTDPPVHTRLRSLVSRAFTPRAVEGLRPKVAEYTRALLDDLAPGDEVDLVAAFAAPLPIEIIAEMLGVPAADREQFARWSDAAALVAAPTLAPGVREQALADTAEFFSYLSGIVRERRAQPRDDMITGLLHAEVDGERLSDHDVVNMAHLLLAAGNETTRALLSNAVATLMAHPDQFRLVKDDPALVPSMVEEVLRYEPSVHMTFRLATEAVVFGETEVPAGAPVLVSLASANRDPRAFSDPETFDVARTPNRHLAFAVGVHRCVGAPLAQLEAQVALPLLFERFPDIRPGSAPPVHKPDALTRGLATLPVIL